METFKVTVRLVVLVFVIVGSMITLAGPDQKLTGDKSISVDKPVQQTQEQDYAESGHSLASSEPGSSG